MKGFAMIRFSMLSVFVSCLSGTILLAAEPQIETRSGTTQKFGDGTITYRSDGSSSRTQKFGDGFITTEKDKTGKTITGITQKFGDGFITRWSDGTTSRNQKFGNGVMTTDQFNNGKFVIGTTQKFGDGTITNRSDGSSSRTQKFGNGIMTNEKITKPGTNFPTTPYSRSGSSAVMPSGSKPYNSSSQGSSFLPSRSGASSKK